jgi:RNA polymerase sigma-70 factor (ECF subfamily)
MLGSMADAEDAVQETYLRWHATDRGRVSEPRAFLMTTTTRICLDMLTSARARREEYVGPWLPEPVLDTSALAPDSRTELAEDLSIALLLILDQLSPLERAAFLLHDVFDFPFSEVATALERSEAACRQLATRARARRAATRCDLAPDALGRDRCQACAAHVRIRGGNPIWRSQCAEAVARKRRAHRDRRRRKGTGSVERDRRR